MSWAFGLTGCAPAFKAELLDDVGHVTQGALADLVRSGVPVRGGRRRISYEGDFADWSAGHAYEYLEASALDLTLVQQANRHEVYKVDASNGLTLLVPALVLMRASFLPSRTAFPAAFKPSGLDLISFVDYSSSPPKVVVERQGYSTESAAARHGGLFEAPIRWMQTSLSARRMVKSAFDNAKCGWLRLSLPLGRVRIIFQGTAIGSLVLVDSASIRSIAVQEEDSIKGTDESIRFYAGLSQDGRAIASVQSYVVPRRLDGCTSLTAEEWNEVGPKLKGRLHAREKHSSRQLLDLILHKIAEGTPWHELRVPSLPSHALSNKFKQWSLDGRLEAVISKLSELRPSADELVQQR